MKLDLTLIAGEALGEGNGEAAVAFRRRRAIVIATFPIDSHLIFASVAVVIAIVLLAVFTARLWAWLRNRTDYLLLTHEGITYGRERWGWERIVACRLAQVPPSNRWGIIIKTRRRGPGRARLIDQTVSLDQEHFFTRYISRFIQPDNGL